MKIKYLLTEFCSKIYQIWDSKMLWLAAVFIALVLMLVSHSAVASDCDDIGETAELIMKARQANYDMSMFKGEAFQDKAIRLVIIDAYSQPLFSTVKMKKRIIKEFKNKYILMCMKKQMADEV